MRKIKNLLIILLLASLILFFWQDIAALYSKFFLNLPKIEQGISGILQETQKQILTPPPLRAEKEVQGAVLTKEGVISWTNTQRVKYGLPGLKESTSLDISADLKVKDMFESQYFAHESPTGLGVADLAQGAGYEFIVIGENLALGNFKNDEVLVEAWMNSQGHRENILNENYLEIGVSVQKGVYEGKTTWLAVQHFGKPISACPQPNNALKFQIETNKTQIINLQITLENLEQEIKTTNPRRERQEYNQKIEQYNALVSQYNNLVSETKNLIDLYNASVKTFNACASGI